MKKSLFAIAISGLMLSGCAEISNEFKDFTQGIFNNNTESNPSTNTVSTTSAKNNKFIQYLDNFAANKKIPASYNLKIGKSSKAVLDFHLSKNKQALEYEYFYTREGFKNNFEIEDPLGEFKKQINGKANLRMIVDCDKFDSVMAAEKIYELRTPSKKLYLYNLISYGNGSGQSWIIISKTKPSCMEFVQ